MFKRFFICACILIAIVFTVAFYVSRDFDSGTNAGQITVKEGLDDNKVPVSLAPKISPKPTIVPTSAPSPSPSPAPSPVPFSYYAPTTTMSFEELIGDNGNYDLPKGYPAPDTYRIIVDKTFQVVLVYRKDAENNYTVPVRYMLCSTGTRTPVGEFIMKRYRVRFGYFQNDKTFGQYWSLINGRIYFHSILYTERNNASSYLEEPYTLLGTPASHGCIRLTVPDARFIFYNISYGSVVEIREGDTNDSETANIRAQLQLARLPDNRVTITPEMLPDTDNWKLETIPLEVPYEEGSQKGQE